MKRHLSIHFFLFLVTSLFTVTAFSQALPDPGNDPLAPVDSIVQTHVVKRDVPGTKDTINLTASNIPTEELANNDKFSPAYNREEKPKQVSNK